MFVLVDSNEGMDRAKKKNEKNKKRNLPQVEYSNTRFLKRLQQRFPEVQTAPLTCGDINVIMDDGKLLAIERKRAGDFIGSIREGHIFKQVERMANNADWSCIVIEGLISFDKDDMAVVPIFDKEDRIISSEATGWHGNSVRNALWAIGWSGCPVITINPHQLPDIVMSLTEFCQKPPEHSQMLTRKRIVTFPPISIQEDIMASFPGIHLSRARSLRDFAMEQNDNGVPTLAEMLVWASHLAKIAPKSRPEGWGNVTVTNFRGAMGLQDGEYLTIEVDKEELVAKRIAKQKENERSKYKSNGKTKRSSKV